MPVDLVSQNGVNPVVVDMEVFFMGNLVLRSKPELELS